jgi:hypothetical protein
MAKRLVHLPSTKVDGLDLLAHHKSLHVRVLGDCHMKRVTPVSASQGAYNGETRLLVEQGVAHHKRRTTTFLFVTRLGVEGHCDEIPLLRNVRFHLPDLSANQFTPIDFLGLGVLVYA